MSIVYFSKDSIHILLMKYWNFYMNILAAVTLSNRYSENSEKDSLGHHTRPITILTTFFYGFFLKTKCIKKKKPSSFDKWTIRIESKWKNDWRRRVIGEMTKCPWYPFTDNNALFGYIIHVNIYIYIYKP